MTFSTVRRFSARAIALIALGAAALACLLPKLAQADPPFPDPPLLKLVVNTTLGTLTLKNDDDDLSVDVDFYRIDSGTGSLVPGNWLSLQDQNLVDLGFPAGDGSGNGWEEFGVPTVNSFIEGYLFGFSSFDPGTSIYMGQAFNQAIFNPEITLRFAVADGSSFGIPDGTVLDGVVQYATSPIPDPDVNHDGLVDIFDVNLISESWGSSGTPGTVVGDATGDGLVDIFDVNLASENWSPPPVLLQVPEPNAIVFALAALMAGAINWGVRSRRPS